MQEIAEQVDRAPWWADGTGPKFDRANQIQSGIRGRADCLVVAGARVVVRNCESLELQGDGMIDQFRRRITTIRLIGVSMQIDHSSSFLNRKAFAITETELRVMAA